MNAMVTDECWSGFHPIGYAPLGGLKQPGSAAFRLENLLWLLTVHVSWTSEILIMVLLANSKKEELVLPKGVRRNARNEGPLQVMRNDRV